MRRTAPVVLLCVLLTGCFSYVTTHDTPARASRVRVLLAAPTDFRLTDFTANEVVSAEGEMVQGDDHEIVLSVLDLRARSGYEFPGRGETLRIPRSNITTVQVNRISPIRTGLLAGVVALVSTVTERLVLGGGGTGSGKGGGPPVET